MKNGLLLVLCLMLLSVGVVAQEESAVMYQGKRYISLNIKSLNKYNERIAKQQVRMLQKLKSKEKRYANKLKHKDSAAYVNYLQQPLTYDSISKLQKADSGLNYIRISKRGNAAVDSLKNIQTFLQTKIHLQEDPSASPAYDAQLNQVKAQGNYNNYINDLISQRTNSLSNVNKGAKLNTGAFRGISKQVFYSKEKMKVFKSINEEPSEAEDEAMETLQGYEGFDKAMQTGNPNSMEALAAKGATTSDLEKMGYQTKRQVNAQLQQRYGANLSGIQQKMGSQVQEYEKQLKQIQSAKNNVKRTKTSLINLTHPDKPSFKVNPMRGLPFFKRIEKQFNWQTSRAAIDGKPAMLQLAAMAGFRHTPKLSYGVGLATSLGLGQNWSSVHFSIQGVGLRSYASWQLLYGIGVYGGYERMFKQAVFINNKNEQLPVADNIQHNTSTYSESILLGLTKTYRVNDKWNGSMQVLYDIWWKEKGLRSPIILRIATLNK